MIGASRKFAFNRFLLGVQVSITLVFNVENYLSTYLIQPSNGTNYQIFQSRFYPAPSLT